MPIQAINPKAEAALQKRTQRIIIGDAYGLQELLATNLGPKGTLKMLVGGAGDIKTTKDGKTLLSEMQIQSPVAALIARAAASQDDIVGDGTTSVVVLVGEVLARAAQHIEDGLHPRTLSDGIIQARNIAAAFLDEFKIKKEPHRDLLVAIAKTAVATKVEDAAALAQIAADAVLAVKDGAEIDLHRVEIVKMQHRTSAETKLVRGLVLDHGARHPNMPSQLESAHVLILNVSLEYEKTEVNSGFFYNTADKRENLAESERAFTDEKVRKIIRFKQEVCKEGESFVVVNQKGIDPVSLGMLAGEGIFALRRAKRRNMERLQLCCGGQAQNSVDDLAHEQLGYAGKVHETQIGEEKFTFIEDVRNPKSVTVLVRGQNTHTIARTVDAVRDGLRAVKNFFDDDCCVVPGGGAFNVALSQKLDEAVKSLFEKKSFGIKALAEAVLIIPRLLAKNAGLDPLDSLLLLQESAKAGTNAGLDLETGKTIDHDKDGVWDNCCVHRQLLESCTLITSNLLIIDGMIRAGKSIK
ncbi:MAG: T-complex protein 1 subunit zeta [Amphiamblys sp. WSBS2006]|nr:MAG: T-complex protein 1 subunit zeta [Amphiamblys sp. WSBS2006]